MAYGFTALIRKTALDAALANLNSGTLKGYTGTRPATADTALSGNTLTFTVTFGATAFGAATTATPSVATANAITQDSAATGNASPVTFFRAFKSDGTTVVLDGNIGISGSDLNLNSTTIVAGGIVQISAMTVSL